MGPIAVLSPPSSVGDPSVTDSLGEAVLGAGVDESDLSIAALKAGTLLRIPSSSSLGISQSTVDLLPGDASSSLIFKDLSQPRSVHVALLA